MRHISIAYLEDIEPIIEDIEPIDLRSRDQPREFETVTHPTFLLE